MIVASRQSSAGDTGLFNSAPVCPNVGHEPPLTFCGCPHRVAVPVEWVFDLAVPLKVAYVTRLQVDRMALVERTHEPDASVGHAFGLCLGTSRGLCSEEQRKHCNRNPNPAMSHIHPPEATNCGSHRRRGMAAFSARVPTISAKSACSEESTLGSSRGKRNCGNPVSGRNYCKQMGWIRSCCIR